MGSKNIINTIKHSLRAKLRFQHAMIYTRSAVCGPAVFAMG